MRTYNCVTLSVLQDVVNSTTKKTGLTAPPRPEIESMYYNNKHATLPVVCMWKDGIMWVDKYYVAYQLTNGDVHYTYITRHHMNEEISGYKAASKLRGQEKSLPEDIRRAFDVAKQYMADIHEDIWVDTLCK